MQSQILSQGVWVALPLHIILMLEDFDKDGMEPTDCIKQWLICQSMNAGSPPVSFCLL